MSQIKEINVFTNGDSRKVSTWSNVPYFFTETLIEKGIKVNRIDIGPSQIIGKIYNTAADILNRFLKQDSSYTYFRSWIHYLYVQWRMKSELKRYKNADANIFLTFSFSTVGLTAKPTVLFCDWTYDYYFRYFLDRQPNSLEAACIKREDYHIESADLIFPLFPGVADYMKKRYQNQNIFYLGNVVNSLLQVTESEILEQKSSSRDILFIGSRKYIEGAKYLIQAYTRLQQDLPDLSIHIIGMTAQDFGELPKGVHCYGYLDKANEKNREVYYSLLMRARVIVNTTPKWGAFSATLEAMYFYNPVITTPYDEFVETFGSELGFGYYCENGSIDLLCAKIREVFESESYESLCINANEAVKDYTWSAYIDKVLNHINGIAFEENSQAKVPVGVSQAAISADDS